jgi:hypothetical protein
MPSMNWEDFQRDHHRSHLLIVSMAHEKPKRSFGKADFERLAVSLGACGNYAIRMEGTAIYAAFEDDADAQRFSAVLRPTQSSRESEWASKTLAQIDNITGRRIAAILKTAKVKRRRSKRQ